MGSNESRPLRPASKTSLFAVAAALVHLLSSGCQMADLATGGHHEGGGEPPWDGLADHDGGNQGGGIEPGTLTTGVWDDNQNFDYYLEYLADLDGEQLPGRPVVEREDRLVVQVTDGGRTLPGTVVTLVQGGNELARTITGADGRALFFPTASGAVATTPLTVRGDLEGQSAALAIEAGTAEAELVIQTAAMHRVEALDLTLIIDTTGSMGDEIRYLAVEIDAIAAEIASEFPNVDQRYGLVLYRDIGDEYVTRVFDFTSDLAEFRANLAAQSAAGGGDYPEALDQGLQAGVDLSWRDGKVARVAFLIADAPHHVGNEGAVRSAIFDASERGIRLYPVAASGADRLTEYTMRTMAQVTGGRFMFLTDDSGIGDPHLEPTIPCYHVTRFDQAMVRMIAIEITGEYIPVDPEDVIRTGGDPQDGRCTFDDGSFLLVF
jgi:Mg-chelatase subunit ChlD